MQRVNQPISTAETSGLMLSNHQIRNEKNKYDLARLRQEMALVDGHKKGARLPLGIDSLDQALAGGLALGRVHLLSGAMQAHGAVSGFTIALLAVLQHHARQQAETTSPAGAGDNGLIVWCPASQRGGNGMLYGHGLAAAGLDPARLLIVDTPSPSRRLAALDDILRTEGVAAVVMEYDGVQKSADYWMRLARRAQLAAEENGATAFLLGAPIGGSGFETAWQIKPAADLDIWSNPNGLQHNIWDLSLQRARGGRPYICRAGWQAGGDHLYAVDHVDISTNAPVQAELAIHQWPAKAAGSRQISAKLAQAWPVATDQTPP
ncbi:MAG: ImuA family protein, partial [Candidatus Puniceispirillaceae bacterium]